MTKPRPAKTGYVAAQTELRGVLDCVVAFEGSTNWSTSGEGVGISLGASKQQPGFKAQNNTLAVYVNPYEIAKFSARLDYEHAVAARKTQPPRANSARLSSAKVLPHRRVT